jgi:hypothetical protein
MEFLFRPLLTKGDMEVLKGYFSVLPIEVITQSSHLSPHPKRKTFWKKIDEKAKSLEEQILHIAQQRNNLRSNYKSQIPNQLQISISNDQTDSVLDLGDSCPPAGRR